MRCRLQFKLQTALFLSLNQINKMNSKFSRNKLIITGHSTGLGRALAEYYLQQGWQVLGLARRNLWQNESLQTHILDLSDTQAVEKFLHHQILKNFIADADRVLLINNAASSEPNALAGSGQWQSIASSVALNVATPLILSDYLLQLAPKCLDIVHISSGAGRKHYPAWSVYGSTKAALDHHALTLAAEQHENLRIVSIAPGVIDTEMQANIRAADGKRFPNLAYFQELKQGNALLTAKEATSKIIAFVNSQQFGQKIIADVRDDDV